MCGRAFPLLALFHPLCPNVCFCMDAVPVALAPLQLKANLAPTDSTLDALRGGCSSVKSAAHPSRQGASAVFTRHFKINTLITGYASVRSSGRHHSAALTQQSATLGAAASVMWCWAEAAAGKLSHKELLYVIEWCPKICKDEGWLLLFTAKLLSPLVWGAGSLNLQHILDFSARYTIKKGKNQSYWWEGCIRLVSLSTATNGDSIAQVQ